LFSFICSNILKLAPNVLLYSAVQQLNVSILCNALAHFWDVCRFLAATSYLHLFILFLLNSTEMADSGKGKVLQNTGKFVSENRTEGW